METILLHRLGASTSDPRHFMVYGTEVVTKIVSLFDSCAYAPSDKLVGEFVSQVQGSPDPTSVSFGLILAVSAETLLGALMFRCLGEIADLDYIGVARSARGVGLGKKMIDEFERLALSTGCQRALLEVSDRNVPALAAYRSAGYEEIARRKRYYPSGEDALVMEKHMESSSDFS